MEVRPEAVISVRIAGSEKFSIARKPRGRWSILPDRGDAAAGAREVRADAARVEAFLEAFAGIDAKEFIDNPVDLETYGLAEGSERLKITLETLPADTSEPKGYTIVLGSKTGGAAGRKVFAKLIDPDRTTVFTLPASMLERLQANSLDLRNRAVMPLAADSVRKIELTVESESMTLTKTKDSWRIAAPAPAAAHRQRVALLLERLAGMRATGFRHEKATDVEFGFDEPRGLIRLYHTGADKPATLEIGAESPTGAVVFVRSSATDAIAAVPARDTGPLLASTACYYDPVLWQLPSGARVSRITMKRQDGTFELDGRGAEGTPWRLTKPLEAPADADNVNFILDRLDRLTATRIVSVGVKTRAYYARGQGTISATFAVRPPGEAATQPAGGARTFGLSILEGKIYGWMEDDPLGRVGLFSRGLYGQFSAELRRRRILDFDPKTIDKIVIASGKVRTTLDGTGGVWKYPGDPDLKIDPDKVSDFLADVGTLRALRFVVHEKANLSQYKLDESGAWLVVDLAAKNQRKIRVIVSPRGSDETKNRFATADGVQGVFTVSAESAAKLARKLADFKKPPG